ncbi:MAG: hypothetical protein ACRD0K_25385 [Egibacteraceae bacterium]
MRTQTRWERQIGGLTVEPDPVSTSHTRVVEGLDHLIISQRLVTKLAAAARALVASELCDQPCLLAAKLGSQEACELAHDLAELAPPAVTATPDPITAYTQALREAAHAVYYCRRFAHAGGQCWFSPAEPGLQRCRRVLTAAHRVG